MFRIFITYVLPLLAPLIMYIAWNAYVRSKAKKLGEEPPSLEKASVFWSLVAGFILLVVSLISLAIVGGENADGGQYIPPRYEDGKIIPPSFKKN